MNNFNDKAKIRGVFNLRIFNAAGDLLSEETSENLIVDLGRAGLATMLAGDISGDNVITYICFGDNEEPPAPGDVALADPFFKDINGISFPVPTTINVAWSLELTENNGSTIREFGLLTLSETLFSRKVRGTAIFKTADIRLEGVWTIYL